MGDDWISITMSLFTVPKVAKVRENAYAKASVLANVASLQKVPHVPKAVIAIAIAIAVVAVGPVGAVEVLESLEAKAAAKHSLKGSRKCPSTRSAFNGRQWLKRNMMMFRILIMIATTERWSGDGWSCVYRLTLLQHFSVSCRIIEEVPAHLAHIQRVLYTLHIYYSYFKHIYIYVVYVDYSNYVQCT